MASRARYWIVTVTVAGCAVESTKTPRPLTDKEIELFAERVKESYAAMAACAEVEVRTTEL
jgi:hypothetical protein